MKTFIHNLLYRSNGDRTNKLIYIFFFITFVFGIGFAFFGHTASIQSLALYKEGVVLLNSDRTPIWGYCALAVAVVNVVALGWLKPRWCLAGSMAGVILWLYALFIYAFGGYWFQLFAGGIPNVLFWAWYYLRVNDYIRFNIRPN